MGFDEIKDCIYCDEEESMMIWEDIDWIYCKACKAQNKLSESKLK